MALTIGELTGYLRLDDTLFGRGITSARRQLASLKKDVDKSARNIKTIGEAAQNIGKPVAMAALAAGAVSITSAAVPAAGALLAGASAAGIAGAAFAATKMATSGVGDALSALADGDAAKAAEALAKLAPNAQIAVRAMDSVRKSYEGVQQRVQDAVFKGLGEQIKALGADYLPMLDRGLVAIGGSLNTTANSFMLAARGASWMGAIQDILGAAPGIVEDLGVAALGLATSFLQASRAAIPMVKAFASWASDGAATAAAFLSSAEGAAWLADRVNAAQHVLGLLWDIVSGVGSALVSVFTASAGSGETLLVTLGRLTQQFATWAQSAEGQDRLVAIFESLRVVLESLLQAATIFGGALGTLLGWFTQLPAPVQSVIAGFLSWSLLLGTLVAKFAPLIAFLGRLAPLLTKGAGSIITVAARWGLLGSAARSAATVAGAGLRTIVASMARAAIMMMARAAVMAASWLVAMGPIGWLVAAVIAAVALIIMNWDKVKAALVAVGQFFAALPGIVGSALASLGAAIAAGATAAWNWLVSAAQTAATAAINFLLALPGQVAYALGYLAGMVYVGALAAWRFLSETLPAVIEAALAWLAALPGRVLAFLVALGAIIAAGALAAWNWLLSTTISVGTAVINWVAALPGRIGAFLAALPGILLNAAVSAWTSFKNSTVSLANSALAFIGALPGRIMGFFSAAGTWLVNAGKQIIQGLWNGLKSMAQAVLDWIANLGKRVADGFKAAVGIASPSKVFADHGVNIGRGIMVGLDRVTPKVLRATRGLGDDVSAAFGRPGITGARNPAGSLDHMAPEDIAAAVEAGAARAFGTGRMTLRVDGRGVARLVNKQNAEDYRLGSARTPVRSGRR